MTQLQALETLIQSFSPENLVAFMRSVSGSFKPLEENLNHFLPEVGPFTDLRQLGRIDINDVQRLVIASCGVGKELTSRTGKGAQYEIIRKTLDGGRFDAGVFAFYDPLGNFRFSLVVKQAVGTHRTFSSFRRYTYFVSPQGNNRTFKDQVGTQADFSSIENLIQAFSVEVVTKEFFKEYERIFREAEVSIKLKWTEDQKRIYTQRFFNRIVFLAFLERKEWLTFNGRSDYLKALFDDYTLNDSDKRAEANFHRKRLNTLFFWGLNNSRNRNELDNPDFRILRNSIGDVPYLNGGLFEKEGNDELWFFPDVIVEKILKDLVYRFNFTVAESTPLDIEVAVDPEMLGKMFEELVTGRHESGSYYTPKEIVSFMCQEALKGYMETKLPAETKESILQFVEDKDPTLLRNPEAVLNILRRVRVCDPACGSGAYLLGILHELLDLRAALFLSIRLDPQTVYERKMEIIQQNIYGVDIDPFAVNIARLRLWLSLIVDYEGNDPPPLPNLDYKIEVGDSLTSPDPSGGLQPDIFRYGQVQEFLKLKNAFMGSHAGSEEKKYMEKQIQDLKGTIKEWAYAKKADLSSNSFDWQVDFAEVFAPELAQNTLDDKMAARSVATDEHIEITETSKEGGFDIILANPPYGASVDREVRDIYFNPLTENGQSKDTYGLFIVRALQLLCNHGQFCFIVSDTWRTIGSHKYLRRKLLETTTVAHVLDLPSWIFNATVNTCILTLSKQSATKNHTIIASELRGIKPGDWKTLSDNLNTIAAHGTDNQTIEFARYTYAQSLIASFENLSFFIGSPKLYQIMSDPSFVRLGNIAEIKYGIRTGNNARFFLQRPEVLGNYKDITPLLESVLTNNELEKLTSDQRLNGISSKKTKKYIVPLNKGGESKSDEKWLPKYFVQTGYYFDWSEEAVAHLKKIRGMRNPEIHFKRGLTFSWTGEYAPTFRTAHLGVYDQSSSSIQKIQVFTHEELLGILNSKFVKYQIKNFIDHSVNSDIGVISSIILKTDDSPERKAISVIVKRIVSKQSVNESYDFSQEEKEIDLLVYKIFGLSKSDILDIETWYKRRYPKLR